MGDPPSPLQASDEIMDCLLDAVMHQVGHVPNYNIEEARACQINAITDAPPPPEEVTPPTSKTGFQAEAINYDEHLNRFILLNPFSHFHCH